MIELALLVEIGQRIGTGPTLVLVIGTGMLGAALARAQGLGVLQRIQSESAAGKLPADALIDGALLLVAAAVLMTPGVLTDAFGFLCLVPPGRRMIRRAVRRRMQRAAEEGRVRVHVAGDPRGPFGPGGGPFGARGPFGAGGAGGPDDPFGAAGGRAGPERPREEIDVTPPRERSDRERGS